MNPLTMRAMIQQRVGRLQVVRSAGIPIAKNSQNRLSRLQERSLPAKTTMVGGNQLFRDRQLVKCEHVVRSGQNLLLRPDRSRLIRFNRSHRPSTFSLRSRVSFFTSVVHQSQLMPSFSSHTSTRIRNTFMYIARCKQYLIGICFIK